MVDARRTVIRSRSRLSLSENVSPAELLASLPPEQLTAFLKRTSDRELEAIEHDWGWWGRPNQQAPKGDWRTWLLLAGRGFGKTRSGAECIRDQVIHHGPPPDRAGRADRSRCPRCHGRR